MTITQLEYIRAVATFKSFSRAASKCFVTQPTLSAQIIKLEEHLDVKIFDRDCSPVKLTLIGEKILKQSNRALDEISKIRELIDDEKDIIAGELKIGVIPSVADSLIPLFIKSFSLNFPDVKLIILELQTSEMILRLKEESIDVGIAATPLKDKTLKERPIYYEPFSIYLPRNHKLLKKKKLKVGDIDENQLLLMSDGHCFKDQVTEFCRIKNNLEKEKSIHFESSSFETLIKLVDNDLGTTVLPYLNIMNLKPQSLKRIREFEGQTPLREISLIYKRSGLKRSLLNALFDTIFDQVPDELKVKINKSVVLGPI